MTLRSLEAVLRRALTALQIAAPTSYPDQGQYSAIYAKKEHDATIAALQAVLAEPVQEPVKPVAQVHPNHLKPTDDGKPWCREVLLYSGDHNGDLSKGENYRVKLYTAPPQSKPLTEEEIERITDEHWPDFVAFTRAVERAHRIGE